MAPDVSREARQSAALPSLGGRASASEGQLMTMVRVPRAVQARRIEMGSVLEPDNAMQSTTVTEGTYQ